MNEISPARRRELKALAHHLDPVVAISANGLSAAVLKEIDTALRAHELIKIRVFGDDRDARRRYLEEICRETGAAPVQTIGKLLVVWRERAEDDPRTAPPSRRRPRRAAPLTKRAAQTLADGGGPPKVRRAAASKEKAERRPPSTAAGSRRR
ncbi:MAG: ribosome assembly RNA-binding protein YhbY [Rhodocyclaceae bacterium]|nr:ribosome assembly RNA-binding protein YhbY [Rhodocyclaceae bacterium]